MFTTYSLNKIKNLIHIIIMKKKIWLPLEMLKNFIFESYDKYQTNTDYFSKKKYTFNFISVCTLHSYYKAEEFVW